MRMDRGSARVPTARRKLALAWVAITLMAPAVAMAGGREAASPRPKRAGEDFAWQGRVAAGKAIEVKGVNGGIVAEATTGSEVEVLARKSGRRSDPDEVRIEVLEHAGGVTLCAVYPTPRGERPNECKPGEGGRMSTRDNDL